MNKKIEFIYITSNGTISNLTKTNLEGLNIENLLLIA